jgi:hypothetical protein
MKSLDSLQPLLREEYLLLFFRVPHFILWGVGGGDGKVKEQNLRREGGY